MISEEQDSLPPWLEPGNSESIPPEALRKVYGQIADRNVTQVCERARAGMRDGWVKGILTVHDALARSGLFKEWCEAAGINYNTAKSIVARAQQPSGNALHTRSVASKEEEEQPEEEEVRHEPAQDAKRGKADYVDYAKQRVYEIKFAFDTEDTRERVVRGLARVIATYPDVQSREDALVKSCLTCMSSPR